MSPDAVRAAQAATGPEAGVRSAAGRAPELIVGRSSLTDAQRGDRLAVRWRTSTRR